MVLFLLEKASLEKIGLPESVVKKLFSALDSGRIVVMPEKSIAWEGQKRWGWWDVDPQPWRLSGSWTPAHQAVLERTIRSKGPRVQDGL
jgi:hypothetical protein